MGRQIGRVLVLAGVVLTLGGCLESSRSEVGAARVQDVPCVLAVDCPLGAVCGDEGRCALSSSDDAP